MSTSETLAEIDTEDMPEPGATRYRVMVKETRRLAAEAAALRIEVAALRRALGLKP